MLSTSSLNRQMNTTQQPNLWLKYLFQKLLFNTPLSINIKGSTGSQFLTWESISNQQSTQRVTHQEQRKASNKDFKETLDNSKHVWQKGYQKFSLTAQSQKQNLKDINGSFLQHRQADKRILPFIMQYPQQLQTSKNPHELEAFNVATTTAEIILQRTSHYIIQKGVYSKTYLWVQNYDKGEKTGHTLELSKHM